jgi:ATP-dependent DNA helicase RecG
MVKRIGLVERTGRGIDRLYRGQARLGHHLPDFHQSNETAFVVRLSREPPDPAFFRFVVELEREKGIEMPIEELLVLWALRTSDRLSLDALVRLTQRSRAAFEFTLDRLRKDGLVARPDHDHSAPGEALWGVSGRRHQRLGPADRDAVAERVLGVVTAQGRVTRAQVSELAGVSADAAKRLLEDLTRAGSLARFGVRRATYYGHCP